MSTATDTPAVKHPEPISFGFAHLATIVVLAIAAVAAALLFDHALPVIAAALVAALIPRGQRWNVRAPLGVVAGLLALFVVRTWPGTSEIAAPPSETGHLLSWIVWIPLAGALAVLFVPRQAHATLRWFTLGIMAATLVMVLVTEWIGKIVSSVIGVPVSGSRMPNHL